MTTGIECNLFRAKHNETGEIHFFVGRFDKERNQFVVERFKKPRWVSGDHYVSHQYFDTFADAVQYRCYIKYGVAAQIALTRYGYSHISPSGWGEQLGDGYSPWVSMRQTRVRG